MSARDEAFRKFIQELPATTGKTIDEWKAEIRKNGPAKYQDRVAWLRTKHKLAYRPACILALQSGDAPADYSDAAGLVNAMYAGPKAGLRPIYERLMEIGKDLGSDISETACKTFVSLKRKYVFLQIKPASRTRIDLGLALPKVKANDRLIETGGLEKGDRISYRIQLSSVEEIDAEVVDWIRKAYELTPSEV